VLAREFPVLKPRKFTGETMKTYPSDGPRNGLRMYKVVARARSDGIQVSAMVPAPIASDGEKNIPAKNLKIANAAKFGAKPAPRVKRIPRGGVIRYTARRPNVSESGAPNIGPSPKAST
jgi:hypothetical protein